MTAACTVPRCTSPSQGAYSGTGRYAGREVCGLHTVALRAREATP
jgi:hypothetical protein